MMGVERVEIRLAESTDLPEIADLFHQAFGESVLHYWGPGGSPSIELTASLFAVCLKSEPLSFWVATADGHVAGYLFAPVHLSRIWRTALTGGWPFWWIRGWISGRFGLGLRPVRLAFANKLSFLRHSLWDRWRVDARILSVAVHPGFQGRGIAGRLCAEALDRFDRARVPMVRLEVRPDNIAAVRLYQRLGFERTGVSRDSQGEWWVMVRR